MARSSEPSESSQPSESSRPPERNAIRAAVGIERADLRDAGVLVESHVRTNYHRITGSRRGFVVIVILVALFGIVFPLVLRGPVEHFGRTAARGHPELGPFGAVLTVVCVAGLYLGASSAIQRTELGSVGPLVRTSIPPAAVALGRLASELFWSTLVFFVPMLAGFGVLLAVGPGSMAVSVSVVLAVLSLLVTTTLLGRALGSVVRYAGVLSGLSAWTKRVAWIAIVGSIYVGQALFVFPADSSGPALSIPPLLPGTPLRAYAGVAFAPLGATLRPLGIAVWLGLVPALAVGVVVAVRVETRALSREEGDAASAATTRGEETTTTPAVLAATPASRVAFRYLLRTRRDPGMISHLFTLVFGAFAFVTTAVSNPALLGPLAAGGGVVGGAIVAGEAYCLNPLGDDRVQLPFLLTSTASTGVLLRGRALAGCIPGLVLGVVGSAFALVSGSLGLAAGHLLLAVVLVPAAAGTALGIGAILPQFEERAYLNVERAHPSQVASFGFLFGGLVVGAIGVVLVHWGVSGVPLAIAACLGYALVVGTTGALGYWFAVRRFDALTLDAV